MGGDMEEEEVEEMLEELAKMGGDFDQPDPDADGTAQGEESTGGYGGYNDTLDGPSGEGPVGG